MMHAEETLGDMVCCHRIDKSDTLGGIVHFFTLAGVLLMAAILAAHAGLVKKGTWGGDEYQFIASYQRDGITFLWMRFWTWSPRPLSEGLLWLYAAAVTRFHRPLIEWPLALVWSCLLAASVPAFMHGAGRTVAARSLVAMSVLVFIVLGRDVAKVLYWPVGGVAYAPVIAVAMFLLFFLSNERLGGRSGGLAISLAWLIAACASEAGALFVAIHGACTVTYVVWRGESPRAMVVYWAAPFAAAAFAIAWVMTNDRAGWAMPPDGDPAVFHHTGASLMAALARAGREFLSLDGTSSDAVSLGRGALVKLLFFAGLHLSWPRPDRRARPRVLLLASAVAMTVVAMLTASFRQFGSTCCEQHHFVRLGLDTILLAAAAIGLPTVPRLMSPLARLSAPVALAAAAMLMLTPRWPDLIDAWRHPGDAAQTMKMTWRSGFGPTDTMILYQPRTNTLFPVQIPPGLRGEADSWWSDGILRFYHKKSVLVLMDVDVR